MAYEDNTDEKGPMSDKALVQALARKIDNAMNSDDGDLSATRTSTLNRYFGKLYGTERDGYSKYLTREVLETVEWVMPLIMRAILSSDKVVVFDPVGPEDEDRASQETDIINHQILKANAGDGFLALHHFIKDTLLNPTSYLNVDIEEKTETAVHTVGGLNEAGLAILMERVDNGEIVILSQDSEMVDTPTEVPMPPPDGQMGGPPVMQQPQQPQTQVVMIPTEYFEIEYRETTTTKHIVLDPLPGEEALIDDNLTTTNVDAAGFSCRRTRKSYSELLEMGYDRDQLDSIGSYEENRWGDERVSRLFYDDENDTAAADDGDEEDGMAMFLVHICNVRIDYDRDGIAEKRRVVLIGAEIFENDETEYQPIVAMSSILVPHKHNGIALGSLAESLQELSTVLHRQLLDNIYKINLRRKIFSQESLTPDGSTMRAMLNTQSEWIPVQGPANQAIFPEPSQSMIAEILPVLQHTETKQKLRTGVAPDISLDPNVLQQSNTGAFMGALEQAGQRVELLVRIIAETGLKQLMRKLHQLMRMHPDVATTIKLRGKWIDVDPKDWDARTDMSVNVGLGFNSKQQTAAAIMEVLVIQKEAKALGLVDERRFYNSFKKLVDSADLGHVDKYFIDPDPEKGWQPPQPPPDPTVIMAEAQAAALRSQEARQDAEAQSRIKVNEQKAQMEGLETQMKIQRDRADADNNRELNKIKNRELDQKDRQLTINEREIEVREVEASSKVDNIDADTELKGAQTIKTTVEAVARAADAGDTQTQARKVIADSKNADMSGDVLEDTRRDDDRSGDES